MTAASRSMDVGPGELADDDPFAELTRIMGHDPRLNRSGNAVESGEDDLSIDLENELLGSMSEFDEVEASKVTHDNTSAVAEPVASGKSSPIGQPSEAAAEADLTGDIDDELMAAFEAEFEETQSDGHAVDHGAQMTDTPSAPGQDREIDPVFDTFNAGAEARALSGRRQTCRRSAVHHYGNGRTDACRIDGAIDESWRLPHAAGMPRMPRGRLQPRIRI